MFRKSCLVFLLVFLFPVFCFGGITTKENVKILYISENYGAGVTPSVKWKTSNNFLAMELSPVYSLGTGGITQTTFANSSQALNTFENTLLVLYNSYINNVANYLKNNKITYAKLDWFYSFYDQSDNNTLKKVFLSMFIYPDGKMRNLGMRVINTNPKILYYIYKSKATEEVPESFGYSDGGKLYKYVLDSSFNTISSTIVDTQGRYDPLALSTTETDPDSGLKLLINEVIKPEILNYNALFAIVDYARRIKPYYECDPNTNECVAVISIESTSRVLNIADPCTGPNDPLGGNQYRNTGRIGYTLEYTFERYMIEENGNYTMTAQSIGYTTTGQNFDKTVQISQTSSSDLQDYIIDPFKTNQLYNFRNDTINDLPCDKYIYAGTKCAQAPITVNSPTQVTWVFRAPYQSYCGDPGPYLFMNSDLGNNIVRWRVFTPDGKCVRFDTYKYVTYPECVPISLPPASYNCYVNDNNCINCTVCDSWWSENCSPRTIACGFCGYLCDYYTETCSYGVWGSKSSPTMLVWEEAGGDLHDRCWPFCNDTDSIYILPWGLQQSYLSGSNVGCRSRWYNNANLKLPWTNHRNASNCRITPGCIHGVWYKHEHESRWRLWMRDSLFLTRYWNFYRNY